MAKAKRALLLKGRKEQDLDINQEKEPTNEELASIEQMAVNDLPAQELNQQKSREFDLSSYLAPFRRYPLLTQDEFNRLRRRWECYSALAKKARVSAKKTPERNAELEKLAARATAKAQPYLDRLVYSNMLLVAKIALKYQQRGLPLLDLVQEGTFGLMKAVERFDKERGFRFSTMAIWWIKSAILDALYHKSERLPFRLPTYEQDKRKRIGWIVKDFVVRYDREPTDEELFELYYGEYSPPDQGTAKRRLAESRIRMGTDASVYLDAPAYHSPKGEDVPALVDMLAATDMVGAERRVIARADMFKPGSLLERIRWRMYAAGERERLIFRMRYVDGLTLDEIKVRFGLSKERIRQVLKRRLVNLALMNGVSMHEMKMTLRDLGEAGLLNFDYSLPPPALPPPLFSDDTACALPLPTETK